MNLVLLVCLGCLWCAFGFLWGGFGPLWLPLGALGRPLAPFGVPLGSLWLPLGWPWLPLGCHWAPFGRPWLALGGLGSLWVPLGSVGSLWELNVHRLRCLCTKSSLQIYLVGPRERVSGPQWKTYTTRTLRSSLLGIKGTNPRARTLAGPGPGPGSGRPAGVPFGRPLGTPGRSPSAPTVPIGRRRGLWLSSTAPAHEKKAPNLLTGARASRRNDPSH